MKATLQNSKFRNALLLIYVLAVLVFSAAARAGEMTIEPVMHNSASVWMKDLVGEIAIAIDGRAYLVVSDQESYQLQAQDQDLTALNGRQVEVKGYELVQTVGPVVQTFSLVPLTEEQDANVLPAPVLVVLQIRELVE